MGDWTAGQYGRESYEGGVEKEKSFRRTPSPILSQIPVHPFSPGRSRFTRMRLALNMFAATCSKSGRYSQGHIFRHSGLFAGS